MDSHWYKRKKISNKKKHTLHSLGVGFVFFLFLFIITKIFSVSLCPVKNIFGVSCFGCGMTRGFVSILDFDFKLAYEYNVLSIPLFICIAIYGVLALIDCVSDTNYVSLIENQLSKKYMYLVYIFILAVSTILNNM